MTTSQRRGKRYRPLSLDEELIPLEKLIQEIEKWAPKEYREERQRLYSELKADGIAIDVLLAVRTVRGFWQAELRQSAWEKLYWHERRKLERQLEKIREHPLVLRFAAP